MIKQTIKFDSKLLSGKIAGIKSEIAAIAAGIVNEGFVELLMDAPQRSGNYVANMAVQAGHGGGSKGGETYFPINPKGNQMFARGNMKAVMVAIQENKNIVANLSKHIESQAGLWPGATIYNRLVYAKKVEGYTADQLRAVNAEGAHAMTRAKARIEIAIADSARLKQGTMEWYFAVARGRNS